MKKTIIALFAGLMLMQFAACNQAPTMDTAAMDKKIDSTKQAALEKLQSHMDTVCQARLKNDVNKVADSIYTAMKASKNS